MQDFVNLFGIFEILSQSLSEPLTERCSFGYDKKQRKRKDE